MRATRVVRRRPSDTGRNGQKGGFGRLFLCTGSAARDVHARSGSRVSAQRCGGCTRTPHGSALFASRSSSLSFVSNHFARWATAKSMNTWSSGSAQRIGARACWLGHACEARPCRVDGLPIRQPRCDRLVVQHTLQFLAHARGSQPAKLPRRQGRSPMARRVDRRRQASRAARSCPGQPRGCQRGNGKAVRAGSCGGGGYLARGNPSQLATEGSPEYNGKLFGRLCCALCWAAYRKLARRPAITSGFGLCFVRSARHFLPGKTSET